MSKNSGIIKRIKIPTVEIGEILPPVGYRTLKLHDLMKKAEAANPFSASKLHRIISHNMYCNSPIQAL